MQNSLDYLFTQHTARELSAHNFKEDNSYKDLCTKIDREMRISSADIVSKQQKLAKRNTELKDMLNKEDLKSGKSPINSQGNENQKTNKVDHKNTTVIPVKINKENTTESQSDELDKCNQLRSDNTKLHLLPIEPQRSRRNSDVSKPSSNTNTHRSETFDDVINFDATKSSQHIAGRRWTESSVFSEVHHSFPESRQRSSSLLGPGLGLSQQSLSRSRSSSVHSVFDGERSPRSLSLSYPNATKKSSNASNVSSTADTHLMTHDELKIHSFLQSAIRPEIARNKWDKRRITRIYKEFCTHAQNPLANSMSHVARDQPTRRRRPLRLPPMLLPPIYSMQTTPLIRRDREWQVEDPNPEFPTCVRTEHACNRITDEMWEDLQDCRYLRPGLKKYRTDVEYSSTESLTGE